MQSRTWKHGLPIAAGLLILLGIAGAFALELDLPWDPGICVGWSDVIVEGTLDNLWDSAPREMPEFDNFRFRGQAGVVTVARVVYDKTGRVLARGDTLSFFHRTASESEPQGDIGLHISDTPRPIDVQVGATGYFAFKADTSRLRPAWTFYIGEERAKEVDAFLASLQADSAATVGALLQRHQPFGGFTFLPVGR